MSVDGTFRTCWAGLTMSVAGGKAEVPELGNELPVLTPEPT